MIGKNQRISKNRVSWLLKKGQKVNDAYFSTKFHLNKAGLNRYSVVVSKKTLKLATDRNLLRRQCYEILRQLQPQNHSIDFIILIKSPVLKLSFPQLEDQLSQSIQKITSNLKTPNG